MPWLVEHAGNVLTLFEVGSDGRTPYQRLRGRKMKIGMVEFGEIVHYMPLDIKNRGKLEPRFCEGVYLGINMTSSEAIIGTELGIVKARTVRRVPEESRWSAEAIEKISGVPWKPYGHVEDDKIYTRVPVHEDREVPFPMERESDPDPAPKGFNILRRHLITYGFTPGCPGCYAAKHNAKYKNHTPACREIIRTAMVKDEVERRKIEEAQEREDAWLERRVAEGARRHEEERGEVVEGQDDEQVVDRDDEQVVDRDTFDGGADPMDSMDLFKEVDQDLEDKLISIPDDGDSMVELIGQVIQKHVTEVYSPPRITALAREYGLNPGDAMDLTTMDEDGNPWNFDDLDQRQRAKEKIRNDKPSLLIGSPMCTAFSLIQNLNKERIGPKRWNEVYQYGLKHLLFMIELYGIQLNVGRYIIHEHPNGASSWHVPEVTDLMAKYNL